MSRKGILKASAYKHVCMSALIEQGLDEKSLEAKRPPIRSLLSKAYLKAPNRHRFGIHGISNKPEEEDEPELTSPKRKRRVRFSRFSTLRYIKSLPDADEGGLERPRIVMYSRMSLRDQWDMAQELNGFKRDEMLVHPGSIQNTTFFEAPSLSAIGKEMAALKAKCTQEMVEACRLVKGSPDLTMGDVIKTLEDDFKSLQVQSASASSVKRKSGHCRRNAVLGLSSLLEN